MSLLRPARTLMQARLCARQHTTPTSVPASTRSYHIATSLRLPYKDDQDRESLKPRSTEGTKSGSDQGAAESDAAFDGSKTSPEQAKDAAGKEAGNDTLNTSGANQEMSKPQGDEGDQQELKTTTRQETNKKSGGGSPRKDGKV